MQEAIEKGYLFLNGVCRHEREQALILRSAIFLNGVCRHELDHIEVDQEI